MTLVGTPVVIAPVEIVDEDARLNEQENREQKHGNRHHLRLFVSLACHHAKDAQNGEKNVAEHRRDGRWNERVDDVDVVGEGAEHGAAEKKLEKTDDIDGDFGPPFPQRDRGGGVGRRSDERRLHRRGGRWRNVGNRLQSGFFAGRVGIHLDTSWHGCSYSSHKIDDVTH